MTSRRLAAVLALFLLLASASAAADDTTTHVQTTEPRLICIPPMPVTRCRELPPGRFVDEGTWTRIDAELRRAQDAETRLRAENVVLRERTSGWAPGWRTIALVFAAGLAGGAYVAHEL